MLHISITPDTPSDLVAETRYLMAVSALQMKVATGIQIITPREAAVVLGLPHNSRLNSKLQWLIDQGFIERWTRNGSSTYYDYHELTNKVLPAIQRGDIQIPTK